MKSHKRESMFHIQKVQIRELNLSNGCRKLLTLGFAILSIMIMSCNQQFKADGMNTNSQLTLTDSIPANLVCMVNNKYMGEPQIPVKINYIVYYGCCNMCEEQLKNNPETRFAIDPYSQTKVNKAHAYIAISDNDEVLYFENQNHFKKYKNSKQ